MKLSNEYCGKSTGLPNKKKQRTHTEQSEAGKGSVFSFTLPLGCFIKLGRR